MMPVPRAFDLFIKPCKKCRMPRVRLPSGKILCRPCTAEYKRERRAAHRETAFKESSRALAHYYLKRGMLVRLPCEFCGEKKSEMHHWDYAKPLDVTWLCKPCHKMVEAVKRVKHSEPAVKIAEAA